MSLFSKPLQIAWGRRAEKNCGTFGKWGKRGVNEIFMSRFSNFLQEKLANFLCLFLSINISPNIHIIVTLLMGKCNCISGELC